ncbi:hypothetical protein Pcinc_004126 [Petrolisthes cinctipes]|uniref:Uncharacterized protein n=1 Tax=Petrolisthes cinctipes TaxID=88211 RepID=A0AAE1GHH3_PETCI|nr:hypothetical protein Pcinc_004126 [Petrolisthes cinctipes]
MQGSTTVTKMQRVKTEAGTAKYAYQNNAIYITREKKTPPLPPRTEEQETRISVVVNGMVLETINLVNKDHSCIMTMHLYDVYGKVHPKLV